MSNEEYIDFRAQVEQYAHDPRAPLLAITLLSGDKYYVFKTSDLVIGRHVVLIIRRGGETMFPFEAICNIDVTFR